MIPAGLTMVVLKFGLPVCHQSCFGDRTQRPDKVEVDTKALNLFPMGRLLGNQGILYKCDFHVPRTLKNRSPGPLRQTHTVNRRRVLLLIARLQCIIFDKS